MIRTMALALAVAVLPAVLHAQDRFAGEAAAQLAVMVAVAQQEGYSTAAQAMYEGRLNEGRSEVLRLTLDPAFEHAIVAVCDGDCTDLDVVVLEENGSELAADRQADALPIVFVPRGHAGDHALRVRMAGCVAGPCRYAVAVFNRPSAASRASSSSAAWSTPSATRRERRW